MSKIKNLEKMQLRQSMKKWLEPDARVFFYFIFTLLIGLISPLAATADGGKKIIPPSQWWFTPKYSPDGSRVLVQSPPPKIVEEKDAAGKTYKSQMEIAPRKTVILNTKDFSLVAEVNSHLFATWSPNGKYLCAHVVDMTNLGANLAIFDGNNGLKLRTIGALLPNDFAWSPDSNCLLIAEREALSILKIEQKHQITLPVKPGESYFSNPCWSPDGKMIASSLTIEKDGAQKNIIKIWEATTTEKKKEIAGESGIGKLGWSPNGKLFIYSESAAIKLLDATSMKLTASISTTDNRAVSFTWSNDKTKFSFKAGGTIHILDAATMKETCQIAGPTNGFFSYDWSQDDNFILISSQNTAAICDALTGKYLGYKTWADASEHTLAPDQKLLVIENNNDYTESEPIALPPPAGESPFKNGKIGSPGWNKNAAPKTVEECLICFDSELSAESKERFKNTGAAGLGAFGGGSFITDSMMADVYGKWSLTLVEKQLRGRGVSDPRDVVAILLRSYWRHLHHKPIKLDEQIKSHKIYWDNQRAVIKYEQDLPNDILECKLKDKKGGIFTIGGIKSSVKVVTFVDTNGYMSAEQLKCLKELRENHSDSNLAIIVCVVPPKYLTKEHWPAIQTKVMGPGTDPSKDIANFRTNCGDIIVADAPLNLVEALVRFVKPSKFSLFGLPQTLVVASPKVVKFRINHFEEKATYAFLEKFINELPGN